VFHLIDQVGGADEVLLVKGRTGSGVRPATCADHVEHVYSSYTVNVTGRHLRIQK
jgi:hypothetical protein